MVWSRIHGKQGLFYTYYSDIVLSHLTLESQHIWGDLCKARSAFMRVLLNGRQISECTVCLTLLNWDIKAILCGCFNFWLIKPRCISTNVNLELCPAIHCPRKSLFFFLSALWYCHHVSVVLFMGICGYHPAGVRQLLSLTHFLSAFLFNSLVQSWDQPGLFSLTLFFYFWNTQSTIQRCTTRNAYT